jgi:hypothetical protein
VRIHAWVCLVLLNLSGCATPAATNPYEEAARRALEVRHALVAQIEAGAAVELVRIEDGLSDRSPSVHGYAILSEPVVVESGLARDLAALLRNDDRFYGATTKACGFFPGYAFRVRAANDPALLICFTCSDILVLPRRTEEELENFPTEAFCNARGELARLLLRALPDDSFLQEVSAEPKNETCRR